MSVRKTTDYKQLVFYITGCQWRRPQTAGFYITGCQWGRPQTAGVLHCSLSYQGERPQKTGVLHHRTSVREATDSWCLITLQDVNDRDHIQLVVYIKVCQWGRPKTAGVLHYIMSTRETTDSWCFMPQNVMSRRKTKDSSCITWHVVYSVCLSGWNYLTQARGQFLMGQQKLTGSSIAWSQLLTNGSQPMSA